MEAHAATLTPAQGIAYLRGYGFKPVTGMLDGIIMDPYRQFPHEIFHAEVMGNSAFLLLHFCLSLKPRALACLNRFPPLPPKLLFQALSMFSSYLLHVATCFPLVFASFPIPPPP
jgi:hypothetical protein